MEVRRINYKIFTPNMSKVRDHDLRHVADHIAADRGIDSEAIFSKVRQRIYTDARALTAIVARRCTSLSNNQICVQLGYSGHKTLKDNANLCNNIPELRDAVERYTSEIGIRKVSGEP